MSTHLFGAQDRAAVEAQSLQLDMLRMQHRELKEASEHNRAMRSLQMRMAADEQVTTTHRAAEARAKAFVADVEAQQAAAESDRPWTSDTEHVPY